MQAFWSTIKFKDGTTHRAECDSWEKEKVPPYWQKLGINKNEKVPAWKLRNKIVFQCDWDDIEDIIDDDKVLLDAIIYACKKAMNSSEETKGELKECTWE